MESIRSYRIMDSEFQWIIRAMNKTKVKKDFIGILSLFVFTLCWAKPLAHDGDADKVIQAKTLPGGIKLQALSLEEESEAIAKRLVDTDEEFIASDQSILAKLVEDSILVKADMLSQNNFLIGLYGSLDDKPVDISMIVEKSPSKENMASSGNVAIQIDISTVDGNHICGDVTIVSESSAVTISSDRVGALFRGNIVLNLTLDPNYSPMLVSGFSSHTDNFILWVYSK